MRLRRLSFVAGWAAVALLALAGFAAFRPDPSVEELDAEAAAASMGHETGALAGLAFAALSGGEADVSLAVETSPEEDAAAETTQSTSTGSIVSETSGWLSQVQVRAIVTRYFDAADVNRAVRVAWCESRFDPNAVDLRTGATGLYQQLPQYWEARAEAAGFAGADPTDPEANTAAAAWAVYHEGGWDTFACGE